MARRDKNKVILRTATIMQMYWKETQYGQEQMRKIFGHEVDFSPMEDRLKTSRDILTQIEYNIPAKFYPISLDPEADLATTAFVLAGMLTTLLNLDKFSSDGTGKFYCIVPSVDTHALTIKEIPILLDGRYPTPLILLNKESAEFARTTFGYLYYTIYGIGDIVETAMVMPAEEEDHYDHYPERTFG